MKNTVILNGIKQILPGDLSCTNFRDHNEPRFKSQPRLKKITHIVVHETAGSTAKGCKSTLLKKGYGVQLILDYYGHLSCHGDLLLETMSHANQLNKVSIGIEVVNPYYPKNRSAGRDYQLMSAKWWTHCKPKTDRRYVLPTSKQFRALRILIPWLCQKLDVPHIFPTWYLNKKIRKIKNWRLRAKPEPGIVAHGDFSKHADGRYLLEDLIADYLITKKVNHFIFEE